MRNRGIPARPAVVAATGPAVPPPRCERRRAISTAAAASRSAIAAATSSQSTLLPSGAEITPLFGGACAGAGADGTAGVLGREPCRELAVVRVGFVCDRVGVGIAGDGPPGSNWPMIPSDGVDPRTAMAERGGDAAAHDVRALARRSRTSAERSIWLSRRALMCRIRATWRGL
jgi:hypothetical protein